MFPLHSDSKTTNTQLFCEKLSLQGQDPGHFTGTTASKATALLPIPIIDAGPPSRLYNRLIPLYEDTWLYHLPP